MKITKKMLEVGNFYKSVPHKDEPFTSYAKINTITENNVYCKMYKNPKDEKTYFNSFKVSKDNFIKWFQI